MEQNPVICEISIVDSTIRNGISIVASSSSMIYCIHVYNFMNTILYVLFGIESPLSPVSVVWCIVFMYTILCLQFYVYNSEGSVHCLVDSTVRKMESPLSPIIAAWYIVFMYTIICIQLGMESQLSSTLHNSEYNLHCRQ